MKGMKLSKTSWLILSAGVFVVVLVGLGLTRSQQLKEQTKVTEELSVSAARLENLQTAELRQQMEGLQSKLEENAGQMKTAQDRLRQTVVSVDVIDEFYGIADFNNVLVKGISNSKISQTKYGEVKYDTTSISATIEGTQADIINFVISLNKGFTTGFVENVSLSIAGEALEAPLPEVIVEDEEPAGEPVVEEEPVEEEISTTSATRAVLSLTIYSLEG